MAIQYEQQQDRLDDVAQRIGELASIVRDEGDPVLAHLLDNVYAALYYACGKAPIDTVSGHASPTSRDVTTLPRMQTRIAVRDRGSGILASPAASGGCARHHVCVLFHPLENCDITHQSHSHAADRDEKR